MSTLDKYLSALPMLHTWDGGVTWNTGGFFRSDLERLHDFLLRRVGASANILETGAGNSTITLLLLEPRRLVSIAPDGELFERIRRYCRENAIGMDALEACVEGSEWVLPRLAASSRDGVNEFDFILIDGCHNWPMVFVDFFYANYVLKPGGYLMIDDVQLHSIKELARLLVEQPAFDVVLDLGKSLVFQRTSSCRTLPEFTHTPYLARKSEEYEKSANPFQL